ncbi:MAG: DeoR/GlpR family DNA-binding transcription regulator [Planctomycetota bacterium]|nr:DeoR/GlpR family DNA-binding transcription regulator [Planctomycetota bacterium]
MHILKQLKKKKRVGVLDLAGELSISPETIRRDLNEMEADGFLKRTHGGAISLGSRESRPLLGILSRRAVEFDKKSAIAKTAAGFVESGDVIAIDNSTTACHMIDFIPAGIKLTLVTYSLQVIIDAAAKHDCNWTCVSLGGIVNPGNLSSHGMLTANALSFFQPRKLFMSCAGIDPSGVMTEGNLLEAEIKRELIKACRKTFLLVDKSKWGQVGSVNEGSAADMDCLITNADVDPEKLAVLRGANVRIVFDG